jgi:glutaconyl-CoA/methylmalonyl-CoA decarboxylase subunit gamma
VKYLADVDGKTFVVALDHPNEVVVDGEPHQVSLEAVNRGTTYSILIDGRSYEAFIERREGIYYVEVGSERHAVTVEDERLGRLRRLGGATREQTGELTMKAPMPGLVVAVRVEPGQQVEQGQGVVILEAMKMENEIRAPRGGVVKAVRVRAGQAVNQGEAMLVIE